MRLKAYHLIHGNFPKKLQVLVNQKFMLVGEPLFTMTVGSPVSKDLAASFSWESLRLHYEGGFALYWDLYTPAPGTIMSNHDNDPSQATLQEDSLTLDVQHLLGLFLMFGICSLICAGSFVWQQVLLWCTRFPSPTKQGSRHLRSRQKYVVDAMGIHGNTPNSHGSIHKKVPCDEIHRVHPKDRVDETKEYSEDKIFWYNEEKPLG